MKKTIFILSFTLVNTSYTMKSSSQELKSTIVNTALKFLSCGQLTEHFKKDIESEDETICGTGRIEAPATEIFDTLQPNTTAFDKTLPYQVTEFLKLIDKGYRFSFFDDKDNDQMIIFGRNIDSNDPTCSFQGSFIKRKAPKKFKSFYVKLYEDHLLRPYEF